MPSRNGSRVTKHHVGRGGAGWDVATTHWAPYDERMPWGHKIGDVEGIGAALRAAGALTIAVSEDLSDVTAPEHLFATVEAGLGPVTALVLCHGEPVDSALLDTTVESFDRHYAVNVHAGLLPRRSQQPH